MDKWVGRRFDESGQTPAEFSPYSDVTLAAGYTLRNLFSASSVSLRIAVDNLLDVKKINALAGTTVGNDPATGNPGNTYWSVAGTSVIATMSAKF